MTVYAGCWRDYNPSAYEMRQLRIHTTWTAPLSSRCRHGWMDLSAREQVPPAIRARVREMNRIARRNEPAGLGQDHETQPPAALRLVEVRAPTLIIIGDLDTPFTLASGAALVAGIPGARRVVIPGMAHVLNLDDDCRVLGFSQNVA
jgi:pimeloyl-ACP methyl ester carboxylesterase